MEVKTAPPMFRGIPKLAGDGYLGDKLDKYGPENARRMKLERRIVWNLIRHLAANGFTPHSVFDGDSYPKTRTPLAAMEAVFALDDATLRFTHPDLPEGRLMGVLLISGNGGDIVSDYSAPRDNVGGWNDVMDAFDASLYD